MKKHYYEDQFLSALWGQTIRSLCVIAAVATLIVTGISTEMSDIQSLQDVFTLIETRG